MNERMLKIELDRAAALVGHFLIVGGVTGMPQGQMEGIIARALQCQFNKGDRVYSTEHAYAQGLVRQPLTYGTVAATPRRGHPMVSILEDGRKAPARFHVKFWERFVE